MMSTGITDVTTALYRARGTAESGWVGPAGNAFTTRMSTVGAGGDALAVDVARLGGSLDAYADALHTAMAGMRRAQDIARDAGLTVSAHYIHMPEGREDPATKAAWTFAKEEAHRAKDIVTAAERTGREIWRDIGRKKYLKAAEFVNGTAEEILKREVSALETQASRLAAVGRTAVRSHLGRGLFRSASAAAEHAGTAARTARHFSKVPYIGVGLTAVDIGMDIHDGKPPAKAVVQGVAGMAVGTAVADATIALVSPVASPVVGVPAGLVLGAVTGELASWGAGMLYDGEMKVAEAAYDNLVPEKVKDVIPDGVKSRISKVFG
jgi:hypothetical protein